MKEDVDVIRDDWLTDNVISFYEEYLERERLSEYPDAHIVLLRPSMCFMLVQTKDPMTLQSALPSFTGITHVFLPVNDCRSPNIAEGGSHWSLLLVSTLDGAAFHYDSLYDSHNPSNRPFAEQAAMKLSVLLGQKRPLRYLEITDSPRQHNGSDCGVYVCMIMKHLLLDRLLRSNAADKISMSMRDARIDAAEGRRELMRLVEGFRREGRRSQSRSRSPWGRKSLDHKSPPRIGD